MCPLVRKQPTTPARVPPDMLPNDMKCYPEEYVTALHTMAKLQMQSEAQSLDWDN